MLEHSKVKDRLSDRAGMIIILSALLVVVSGFWAARISAARTEGLLRRNLLREAETLAFAIPATEAAAIQFTAEDENRPAHRRLRQQLQDFALADGRAWMQTFALADGACLAGPGSLPADHPGFLPPGSPLPFDSHQKRQQLSAGNPSVEGPLNAAFGKFYEATAPVLHPRTGAVLFGISVYADADDWEHRIRSARRIPLGIAGAILIVLLGGRALTKIRPCPKDATCHAEVAGCTLICLLLTLGITRLVYDEEDTRRRETFYSLAQNHAAVAHEQFGRMDRILQLLSGWFEIAETISDAQFRELTGRSLETAAVRGVAWLPRISAARRTAFEQQVRQASGQRDFQIWELDAHGNQTAAPERPFYDPVRHILATPDADLKLGFNASSEPMRATALKAAAATGRTTATPPLPGSARENAPLLIHVFKRVEAEHHRGQTVLVLNPNELLATTVQQAGRGENLSVLSLFEQKAGAAVQICSTSGAAAEPDHDAPLLSAPIFAFGKCYVLRIRPSADWQAENRLQSTPIAAIGGLLMTLLLSALTHMLANRRTLLLQQVQERTLELQQARAYNRALFDSVKEALFIHDPESGRILDVNPSTEILCGLSRDTILHKPIDAICTEGSEYNGEAALERIHRAAQGTSQLFEWQIQTPDGTVRSVEVSLNAARIHDEPRVIACVRDISDRKQQEEELRTSRQQLSSHIENTPLAAIEWDTNWNAVAWNPAAEAIFGYTRSEILGTPATRLIPEDTREHVRKMMRKMHTQTGGLRSTNNNITKDGRILQCEWYNTVLTDEDGKITGVVSLVMDITAKEQALKRLRESRERLALATEAGGIGVWDLDLVQHKLAWDDRMHALYGVSKAAFDHTAEFWEQCVHPEDRANAAAAVTESQQKGTPFSASFRIIRPDGAVRYMHAFAKVLCDDEGTPTRMIGTNQDITLRVEREQVVAESERRYKALVANLPGCAYRCRADDVFTVDFVSEGVLKLCGYTADDFTAGRINWKELIAPEDARFAEDEIRRALEQQRPYEMEFRVRTRDGEERWIWERGIGVYSPAGMPEYIEGFITDVSDRHQAQTQAQATLDALSAHIAILDQDGKILAVNRSWEAFSIQQGAPPETCSAGINYLTVCESATEDDAADAADFAAGLRAVLAGKQTEFEMEYPCETNAGLLWFTARITAFPGTDDPRVAVAHEDVTERRNAEIKLAESEEMLRGILENSTNMFYSHTPGHVLTYISPQIKDLLGYEVEQALERWTDFASDHPVNERGLQLTREAIRSGEAQPAYELQLIHKDGHPVWVEVREAPVVEHGKTMAIVGSLTDISARKAAEEALHARNRELERFNKAAVGRELRMGELKKEINQLCRTLEREEPYPLYSQADPSLGDPDAPY